MSKIVLAAIMLFAISVTANSQAKRGWLGGTWEGTGYQSDSNSTWTMKLDARAGEFLIEYPSLNCGGVWRMMSATRWRARFRETITRGAERCEPRGDVTLLRLGSGQLLFMYSNLGSRQVTATAVLRREGR